jgi:hypothetical protein
MPITAETWIVAAGRRRTTFFVVVTVPFAVCGSANGFDPKTTGAPVPKKFGNAKPLASTVPPVLGSAQIAC